MRERRCLVPLYYRHQLLDQRKIGKIIFDVKQGLCFTIEALERHRFAAVGFKLLANSFDDWKLNPKACAQGGPALTNCSAHRFGQSLRKSETEAGSFRSTILGAKPIERREEAIAFV